MKSPVEIDWLIYCNATRKTGLGHLSRCLGFAEVLIGYGHTVCFLGSYHTLAESMIRATRASFVNASSAPNDCFDEILRGSQLLPKKGLLMDSYRLSTRDFLLARELFADRRIVLLDDFGDRPQYVCDAVINFTITAQLRKYPQSIESYLGLQYFPARSWLREARQERKVVRKERMVNKLERWLIVCGGTDFCKVTERLIDTLATCIPDSEIRVVLANGVDAVELQSKLRSFLLIILLFNLLHKGAFYMDRCLYVWWRTD